MNKVNDSTIKLGLIKNSDPEKFISEDRVNSKEQELTKVEKEELWRRLDRTLYQIKTETKKDWVIVDLFLRKRGVITYFLDTSEKTRQLHRGNSPYFKNPRLTTFLKN